MLGWHEDASQRMREPAVERNAELIEQRDVENGRREEFFLTVEEMWGKIWTGNVLWGEGNRENNTGLYSVHGNMQYWLHTINSWIHSASLLTVRSNTLGLMQKHALKFFSSCLKKLKIIISKIDSRSRFLHDPNLLFQICWIMNPNIMEGVNWNDLMYEEKNSPGIWLVSMLSPHYLVMWVIYGRCCAMGKYSDMCPSIGDTTKKGKRIMQHSGIQHDLIIWYVSKILNWILLCWTKKKNCTENAPTVFCLFAVVFLTCECLLF